MGKDFAFMFMPGDYLRDTQCLSEKTQVSYDRIMCEHMRNTSEHMSEHNNNIGITKTQLKFFTKRLSEEEKEELLNVLSFDSNIYYIEWVRESISKRASYIDSRKKNRSKKLEKICETYVPHMENEIEIENKDELLKIKICEKIGFENVREKYEGAINQTPFLESLSRLYKIDVETVQEYVGEFIDKESVIEDNIQKTTGQIQSHFRDWVKKQYEKPKKEKLNWD